MNIYGGSKVGLISINQFMFLLITKTQIITNMYNLQRPFHTTNHTRHYMYCTKRLIAAGGNTVSLPCNNAFRQCWAQRAPSCCIKKQYLITKIVINWFTSLQTGERSRDRSKHYLFVEDRLHIYLTVRNRNCGDWGESSVLLHNPE